MATDPHSFLLVLFDGPRDSRGDFIEKPYPRPEIIPTEQVWNLKAVNGVYEWLLRRVNHTGKAKAITEEYVKNGYGSPVLMSSNEGKDITWIEYTLYFAGYTQTLTQITEANPVTVLNKNQEIVEVMNKEKKPVQWLLTTFTTQQTRPPFIQYGFDRDPIDRDSFLSVLHPAKSEFKNLINRASEYALTLALHTFCRNISTLMTANLRHQGRASAATAQCRLPTKRAPNAKDRAATSLQQCRMW